MFRGAGDLSALLQAGIGMKDSSENSRQAPKSVIPALSRNPSPAHWRRTCPYLIRGRAPMGSPAAIFIFP